MSLKKISHIGIIVLLLIGIWGSGGLVWEEIQTGDGCPKIWIVPACAIILLSFLIPLIVHVFKKNNKLYFIFTGLAWSIAVVASSMQFKGSGECPKLDNGTPMCYLSLAIFLLLILLKIIDQKIKRIKL